MLIISIVLSAFQNTAIAMEEIQENEIGMVPIQENGISVAAEGVSERASNVYVDATKKPSEFSGTSINGGTTETSNGSFEMDVGEQNSLEINNTYSKYCSYCRREVLLYNATYYIDISITDNGNRLKIGDCYGDGIYGVVEFTTIKPGIGTVSFNYYCNYVVPSNQGYCQCGRYLSFPQDYQWYRYNDLFNATIYAYYSLNYNANEENVTNMPSTTTNKFASTSANLSVTSVVPQKQGYTFLGWADTPDAEEAQYTSGDSIPLNWSDGLGSSKTPVSKELYAVWKPNATYVEDKDLIIRKEFVGVQNYDAIPKELSLEYEVTNSLSAYANNGTLSLENENLQIIESGENPILEWTIPVPNYIVQDGVTEKTQLTLKEVGSEINGYKNTISSTDEAIIENDTILFEVESTFTEGSRSITNTYEKRNDLEYTINYIEKETGNILESIKVPEQVFQNTIISSEVVEIKEFEGYLFDSIDPESITISSNSDENVINIYYIKNTKSITVVEIWNGGAEESSKVYLKQVSNDSQLEEKTLTPEMGWTHTWDNLKRLDDAGNEIKYTVDGENVEGYYCEKTEDFENNIITLTYNKYGTIQITKVDRANSDILLQNAKFKLEKVIQNEETGTWDVVENDEEFTILDGTTDKDGNLVFDTLKYGFYKLTELEAPKNYIIGSQKLDIIEVNGEKEDLLNVQIVVSNIKQYELPVTGGVGELKGRSDLLIGSIFVIVFFTKKAVVPKRRKKSRF